MEYNVELQGADLQFGVQSGETILSAALRQNVNLGYSCSNGQCGECKATLLDGNVESLDKAVFLALEEKEILTCCATLRSDVLLNASYYPELNDIERKTVPAKIDEISFPAKDIVILSLRIPPRINFQFLAGQYIALSLHDKKRSYSIASASTEGNKLDLHVKKVENGVFSEFFFNELKNEQLLRFYGPLGTFFLRDNDKPLIFICTGTGFAPVKSMVECLIDLGSNRSIHIYWGGRYSEDLYSDLPKIWAKSIESIHFTQVLSRETSVISGVFKGYVQDAVVEQYHNLKAFDIYACGSEEMIKSSKELFTNNGLSHENFYSDAFTSSN